MGIQVCSNERPCPFPRGDQSDIYWKYIKVILHQNPFFCKTSFFVCPLWKRGGEGIVLHLSDGQMTLQTDRQTVQYLLTRYKILIQWMPIESKMTPMDFQVTYIGQRSRSNCCLSTNDAIWCLLNVFWLFCWKVVKLSTVDAPKE